jgi:hypothetical protein
MKSIVFLLFFGALAYFLYVNVTTPVAIDPPIEHVKGSGSAPEVVEAPVVPDLSSIIVKGRAPLTHAKVKEIHPDAMVFICDEGIFKIDFDRLPPEFGIYYGPMAVPDPTPTPTPVPTTSDTPVVAPVRERPQRTTLEDAQASLAYAQAKAACEDRLKSDREILDHYYKQSTYEPVVTESQFEIAKADYDVQAAALAQLEANGH